MESSDKKVRSVAVVGSRSFQDYNLLEAVLDKYQFSIMVSGGASLGERYANLRKLTKMVFKPDWSDGEYLCKAAERYTKGKESLSKIFKLGLGDKDVKEVATEIYEEDWKKGRSPAIIRNTFIVATADILVAFWDGRSPGTGDSIRKGERMGKKVVVVKC